MNFFVPLQHVHKLRNLLRTGCGGLGGLNPEKNGISISTIERSEKLLRPRIAIQRRLKIAWHG
jgi:hypothetical protein